MSKAKAQGTRYETDIVNRLNAYDPSLGARRLAEGGIGDVGDIEVWPAGAKSPLVIEAKHRQALNLHQTVHKARSKAGLSRSVVFWKKLTRKAGNAKRTPDGIPEVVSMDFETFVWLLTRA